MPPHDEGRYAPGRRLELQFRSRENRVREAVVGDPRQCSSRREDEADLPRNL